MPNTTTPTMLMSTHITSKCASATMRTEWISMRRVARKAASRPSGLRNNCCVRQIRSHSHRALYHCLALGIEGPLVGLSYKKTCPIVVLNIAWLDERVEDGNELPIAHLLPASFDEPTASFDLRDPLEAFRLAIVLSRYRHIASQRQHSEETSTALPWRADLCARDGLEDNTQGAHAEYVKEASIVEWAEQVYKSTVAWCVPFSRDAQSKKATKSSASDETQSIGGVSGKSYVKATDTKAASRAQRYFVLRKVCFKSFRERNGLWQAPKESLHALAPAWFYGNIADIGRHMGTVEDALFKELLTAHACHSPCFIGYMTTNVQALVERSLRTLLHVVGTARLLNEQSKRHVEGADEKTTTFEVLNEAMYRGLWDELFRGLAESSGSADVRYRREAKLRYAEYPSRDLEGHRKEVTRLFNWFNNVTQYPEQTDLTAARQEPRSGTADGILYLKVEDIFLDKDVANAVAIWAPTFATGQVEYDEPADAWIQTDEPPPTQFGGSVFASCSRPLFSDQDRAEYRRSTAKRPKPYTDPSPTPAPAGVQPSTTDVPSAPITVRPPPPPKSKESKKAECDGYFPLCANEFKRLLRKWTAGAATNQERLYLVAICTFMRLFNIGRFPVFGLVTSGLTGVLSSAWNQAVKAKDMTHQTICIEDHEATEVHLQNPLDALNVATWIAYIIVEHAPRLRSLFEAATIEDVECAYLLDASGPTPRAKARSMTMQDSHWHKPQSDTQADARYGTSTAKKGRKKANLNAESSRLTSIGE
ncbi:hypothetical protein BD626DRAFT_488340 [Schizophyllum amplum]|uniref:Uncharacterized protein n=1 Tax=Schizophyllum amplum TaxID=97359 RepID=A0A550CKN5_9AGAR|nr:hypothetical protein BD626DRAFT_488340 [Auriculariopsis ampla]